MKKNKVAGILMLILAVATIVGMVINNEAYWYIYNYATLALSLFVGIVLLRQK